MLWAHPPISKVYEALGAIADGRIKMLGNSAEARSSSGNKTYEVRYNPDAKAIMANDSGSFYQGYLGYPAIAFLMKIGLISYDEKLAKLLKGIHTT